MAALESSKYFSRRACRWALVALASAVVSGSAGAAESAPRLLDESISEAASQVEPPTFGYKRSRRSRLDPLALTSFEARVGRAVPGPRRPAGIRLGLNLFPDVSVVGSFDRINARDAGRWVARGTVENVPGSLVLLAVDDGAMAASIQLPGRGTFTVTPSGSGDYRVVEIDSDTWPDCGPEEHPIRRPPARRGGGRGRAGAGAVRLQAAGGDAQEFSGVAALMDPPVVAGDYNTIDVMVMYTTAARVGAGSVAAIQSQIDLAVEEANTCYENSGINARLNLVYRGEIAYTETGNASTDLSRLAATADGYLDGVHALRNQYGADVVCLLTETMASYAGLGYVMSPPSSGFASYAFSVVRRPYAVGQFVFAHEVGHNMGCMHDRQNSTSAGSYSYSYGYRFYAGGTQYRTVMAYAPGNRIPYFSSPLVSYLGAATGVAEGSASSADNVRSINFTAPVVANFRGSVVQVSLAAATRTVTESNETVTLTVTRAGGTNTVTVDYATANGTAVAGRDYEAASGTLTFAADETTKTIDLTLINDDLQEVTENFQLRLSNPIGAALVTATTTITITDDDRSTINLAAASQTVSESNTTVTVNLIRTGASHTAVAVRYATLAGTATAGSDFTAASGLLSFAAGETNKAISLTVIDDRVAEAGEVFSLRLSGPTNAALGTMTNHTVTIRPSDGSVLQLTTNRVYVSEGAGQATVTVRRTGTTNNLVLVNYATADNSATNDVDYTAVSGTLEFAPGVTRQVVEISVADDEVQTRARSFYFRLSSPRDATLSLGTNTVVITDDDVSYVGFTAATTTVWETNDTVTLNVRRTGQTGTAVSVDYATAAGTASAGADFTAASGTLSFDAGETNKAVEIELVNNALREGTERFQVILSQAVNTTIATATNTVAILDDDGSTLNFGAATRYFAESNTTATITVVRTGAVHTAVAVRYATVAGSATAGSDFTAASGMLVFGEGETSKSIDLTLADDRAVEPTNETFYVRLSSPTNAVLGPLTNCTVILRPSDGSVLQLTTNRVYVSESAGQATVTVRRTGTTNNLVLVDYATADNSATNEVDYTATSGLLEFAPGVTTRTVDIPIANDDVVTRARSFYFRLANARDALVGLGTNLVVITEDDVAGALADARVAADGVVAIRSLNFPGDGRLHLRVEGPAGAAFRLEATTDFVDWVPVTTNVLAGGVFEWIEVPDPGVRQRYFRVGPP